MSYSPANTFTAGVEIDADDLNENMLDLLLYINGDMSGSDLESSEWVETRHIMKGEYQPIVNQHEFVTGLVAGQPKSAENVCGHMNQYVAKASTSTVKEIPSTGVTIYAEASGDLYFSYQAFPVAPSTSTQPSANNSKPGIAYIEKDGSVQSSSKVWMQEEVQFGDAGTTSVAGVIIVDEAPSWELRQSWSGFQYISATAGYLELNLKGGYGAWLCPVLNYNFSLDLSV